MSETDQRGECPECGRMLRLTTNGKVWTHGNGVTSIVDPARGMNCRGSGRLPVESQASDAAN